MPPIGILLGPLRTVTRPQWSGVISPVFQVGEFGQYDIAAHITDYNTSADEIQISTGTLPTGYHFDGRYIVSDGNQVFGNSGGIVCQVIRNNEVGQASFSSSFTIQTISSAQWATTPSISIVEGSTSPYSLLQNITNYNATTDEFRVTPGYSLPSWLALTPGPGAGSGNLTPNGTQLDANDIPANPGIKIDVRRSGGAWVSSPAFGVTVAPVSPITATWTNLAYTSVNANKDFYATSVRVDGSGNWLYGPFFNTARQRDYAGMVDGTPDTQAVWDSFATMADDLVHAAPGWVMQETPPWGGWTMYGVNYDFNLVLFVPG